MSEVFRLAQLIVIFDGGSRAAKTPSQPGPHGCQDANVGQAGWQWGGISRGSKSGTAPLPEPLRHVYGPVNSHYLVTQVTTKRA
jgi:hypothetical protein